MIGWQFSPHNRILFLPRSVHCPMATPWTTESPADLKVRVDRSLASFSTPLKGLVRKFKAHDFVICWLHHKGVTDDWEVAGLAQDNDSCMAKITTQAGVPDEGVYQSRTYRFWMACKSQSDLELTRSTKQTAGKNQDFYGFDDAIDTDTRTRSELGFKKRYSFNFEKPGQLHDHTLGMIKSDLEACNLRVIPLNQVWLATEDKRDALKKRKIGDGLALVVDVEDEVPTGGVVDFMFRLRALLIGYCWLGDLEQFRILDPDDVRDEEQRRLHPQYVPILDLGTTHMYVDHFLRAAIKDIPGTKHRPLFAHIIEAESQTREYAFKLVRAAHLDGKSLSLSKALTQAMRDCVALWRFSAEHGRPKPAAKSPADKKSAGDESKTGNNRNKNRGDAYNDNRNWSKNDNGEWVFTQPLKGGGKGGAAKKKKKETKDDSKKES